MTVTEFLEARIAEDEAAAREPRGLHWSTDSCYDIGDEDGRCVLEVGYEGGYDFEGNVIAHMARWDPARVLAECAAKRALVKQHEEWPVLVDQEPPPDQRGPIIGADLHSLSMVVSRRMAWLTEREYVKRFGVEPPTAPMIRALAAVYSDHPDYDKDWAL